MKNETNLENKIYEVRGEKVMLDYELAEIYGYTTKAFNQQVSRNMEKFEGEDFMFRLTKQELEELDCSRSHFVTLNEARGKNIKYLPYAFTESGVYMLMTVLRGELAVKQSRALIRTFRAMKEYIMNNSAMIFEKEQLKLMMRSEESLRRMEKIEDKMNVLDDNVKKMSDKMNDVVLKSEISPILLDFDKNFGIQEYVLMNGQTARADETYVGIYSRANENIFIVDDYINIKSLRMLMKVKSGVCVTIFSDNVGHYLHKTEYDDFKHEFSDVKIEFYRTCGKIHDRFIVLDYGTEDEVVHHCGASAKDAGNRMTAISLLNSEVARGAVNDIVSTMLKNPKLKLG